MPPARRPLARDEGARTKPDRPRWRIALLAAAALAMIAWIGFLIAMVVYG